MRILILFSISILFLSCKTLGDNKSEIENLFAQTKKIEIYAFQTFGENYLKPYYVKTEKVEIPEKFFRNIIILNKNQTLKLKKSLIKTKAKIEERADCYDPRHLVVFYDEKDKIFGYVELCFTCSGTRTSDNLKFLGDKMLFQKRLFEEFGITYFEETKEEREEKEKKWKEETLEIEKKFKKTLEKKQ